MKPVKTLIIAEPTATYESKSPEIQKPSEPDPHSRMSLYGSIKTKAFEISSNQIQDKIFDVQSASLTSNFRVGPIEGESQVSHENIVSRGNCSDFDFDYHTGKFKLMESLKEAQLTIEVLESAFEIVTRMIAAIAKHGLGSCGTDAIELLAQELRLLTKKSSLVEKHSREVTSHVLSLQEKIKWQKEKKRVTFDSKVLTKANSRQSMANGPSTRDSNTQTIQKILIKQAVQTEQSSKVQTHVQTLPVILKASQTQTLQRVALLTVDHLQMPVVYITQTKSLPAVTSLKTDQVKVFSQTQTSKVALEGPLFSKIKKTEYVLTESKETQTSAKLGPLKDAKNISKSTQTSSELIYSWYYLQGNPDLPGLEKKSAKKQAKPSMASEPSLKDLRQSTSVNYFKRRSRQTPEPNQMFFHLRKSVDEELMSSTSIGFEPLEHRFGSVLRHSIQTSLETTILPSSPCSDVRLKKMGQESTESLRDQSKQQTMRTSTRSNRASTKNQIRSNTHSEVSLDRKQQEQKHDVMLVYTGMKLPQKKDNQSLPVIEKRKKKKDKL